MKNPMRMRGFTLIEVSVATGVFIALITVFVGIYSRFTAVQEKGFQSQQVLEQLRGAMEIMNREIRTGFGSTYSLSDGQGRGVVLRNQDRLCVHYRFAQGRLQRAEADVAGNNCSPSHFSGARYTSLTGADVEIVSARFDAFASAQENGRLLNQGTVTIVLEAVSSRASIVPVKLQSTVTSRQVIPYVSQ